MAKAAVLSSPFGQLKLERFPRRSREKLLPWCSADELLLEALAAKGTEPGETLVANDEHGALAVALEGCITWTDSFLAARATEYNAALNGRGCPRITWSTDSPPRSVSCVLMRVPKQLPYFDHQLQVLASLLAPGSTILAAGMDKHLSPHTAGLLERRIGPTERHRGKKKARLFSATLECPGEAPPEFGAEYDCPQAGGVIRAMTNVFSHDHLDLGSRFLIDSLPAMDKPVDHLLDLACGNGVIGLAAYRAGLARKISFCDESAMAVASARENALRLHPEHPESFIFHHGDGLEGLRQQAGVILCNPPFHLGHSVDDFAGRRLLKQCAAHLGPGGQLLIVANAHLKYRSTLEKNFASVDKLDRNAKFIIWRATQA